MAPRGKKKPGRIEKLTPAQQRVLVRTRDEWLAAGFSCEPANRAEAEAALDDAYRRVGKEPPRLKIWLRSPFEGAIASGIWGSDQVRDQVHAQVHDQVSAQVRAQVSDQVRDQVHAQVHDQVSAQVSAQVHAQVRDQVRELKIEGWHWPTFYGQHGGAYYGYGYESYYESMQRLGVKEAERLGPFYRLARSCGWVWAYWDVAIFTERTCELHRDEQGRLHNLNGPAVLYPDGFGVWAVNGLRVPREWVEQRATLDPGMALTHDNVEQRRALVALIGWDKILTACDVQEVNRDKYGVLLSADLGPGNEVDDQRAKFVRVECPSSGRVYVNRVPPDAKTCRHGLAWRFTPADRLKRPDLAAEVKEESYEPGAEA